MRECKILLKTIQNETFHVYGDLDGNVDKLRHLVATTHGYDIATLKICFQGAILKHDQLLNSVLASGDVVVVVGKGLPGNFISFAPCTFVYYYNYYINLFGPTAVTYHTIISHAQSTVAVRFTDAFKHSHGPFS